MKSEPRPISVKDFPSTDRLADANTAQPLLEYQGLLSLGWQLRVQVNPSGGSSVVLSCCVM